MKQVIVAARILLSITGIALLVLGVLFWTGHALGLIRLHIQVGGLLVLSMWILVVAGLWLRVALGLTVAVFVWSLIVPALGMMQMGLLPGSLHWLVEVLHLLVGLAAMGLGHALGRRLLASPRTVPAV